MAVKEFDDFEDRWTFVDEAVEKLLGSSLIMLKVEGYAIDAKSRIYRQEHILFDDSPLIYFCYHFSYTGSKMRLMLQLVAECAEEMSQYFRRKAMANDRKVVDYEMKDLFSKYTNDVCTTAFGIKINWFENENNEFCRVGKSFNN